MRAVVLVGGFGTRLRPLTNDIPKPMLPVGHHPMIVGLVDRLAAGGVTEVTLALGFRPEPFVEAFPDGRCGDVKLRYAVEPEPLDTAGAIRFAALDSGIDDTFVVANGDITTALDVGALVRRHRELGGLATIHLTPVADPSAFGVVEIDDAGQVQRFVEKPLPGETASNLINAGTYVFEPAVLDAIAPDRPASVERETFPALVADGSLFGVATDDYWVDTGRPDEYRRANLDLLAPGRPHIEPVAATAVVAPTSTVIGSIVGAGAQIGESARVVESVVLPGARIGDGALVERSLVMGHVGAHAVVCDAVLGAAARVPDHGVVRDARLPDPA